MSTTPILNQRAFRVRTDTGTVDATPTWAAAEDTSVSLAVETTFRIRFSINNTGTAAGGTPTVLRVSKNGGAYTAVTTSTGATLGAQAADASSSSSPVSILVANHRLSAGTGTAAAGAYTETGSLGSSATNGQYIEQEYGLILKTAGAAAGNTFDFRLYSNTTAFTTYTQTPRVTVPSVEQALLANDVASASSVSQPLLGSGITFRSVANTTYGSSRLETDVPKPTGLTVGDFMLWSQATATTGSAPSVTFPAGWTQIASAGYPLVPGTGGFNASYRVAYKFADSSDVAASIFSATHVSSSTQGAIACYTGVNTTTPLDTTPTQNSANTGVADSTALGLTTVTNEAKIVIFGMDWGSTANNLTPPTGTTPTFTERLDVAPLTHMFDGTLATAGATGDKTFANNADSFSPWACYMLALRPAGAAASVIVASMMHNYRMRRA